MGRSSRPSRPDRRVGRAAHRRASPGRRCGAARARSRRALRSPRGPRRAGAPMTAGRPRLRMPAFSRGDAAERVAEILWWSMSMVVMTVSARLLDDVGRVEPAAETDFEDQKSAGVRLKARKAAAVVISKKVIGSPALAASHLEQRREIVFGDQLAGHADALVEAHEMRRGVDMDAEARGLHDGAEIGDGRALAVGAGDMDHRRQLALRIAELRQQPLACGRASGRCLRMQRQEPRAGSRR